jgi:ubiquinone/menaquinone biosynthesis C-methylase UbiE
VPDYLKTTNYHLQPGGYHGDPLLGHVYHRGTDIYIGGRNTAISSYLAEVPAPPDGKVERILDLGCAIGQSATALKLRYPDAEVHAIDVSAPMIRYGHKRAIELGIEVHFHQQSADALQFPDNSFDLVYAYILFHEVPVSVTRGTMREALRVLRPGGIFVINDVGPRSPLHPSTPLGAWMLDYAAVDNEDPFVRDFIALDLDAELVAAGFPPPSKQSTSEIGLGSKGLVVGIKA